MSGVVAATVNPEKDHEGPSSPKRARIDESDESKVVASENDKKSPAGVDEEAVAVKTEEAKDDPSSDDSDQTELFDYDTEKEKTPYGKLGQLQARARAVQHRFDDDLTFMLALELYNRARCRMRDGSRFCRGVDNLKVEEWFNNCVYECKSIRGRHKNPCKQCGVEFDMDYEYDHYLVAQTGFTSQEKVCVGCMGRNLCHLYGSDKDSIMKELKHWRHKQSRRNGNVVAICTDVKNYNPVMPLPHLFY